MKQGGSSMRPSPAVDEKPVVNEDPAADEKPMLEDEDGPGNILETFLESCTLATDTAKDDDDSPESEGVRGKLPVATAFRLTAVTESCHLDGPLRQGP